MPRCIPTLASMLIALVALAGSPAEAAGEACGAGTGNVCASDEFCKLPIGDCGTSGVVGTCTVQPQACTTLYDPVCGCDGVTYGNECEADRARTPIASLGACAVQVCDGIAGIPCNSDEFCVHADGNCHTADAGGVCAPIPQTCPSVFAPVCGCDGRTYSNRCEALAAEVQVDHAGVCGQLCGGTTNPPCANNEFCKLLAGQCNVADPLGTCQPFPTNCPLFYDPVCGCDGVTYNNDCEADQAGAQIDHLGECRTICGGIAGIPCDPDEYCQFPDGTCDIVDNQGVCQQIPLGCPDVVDPVCGCDGVTYGNRCEAEAVGAQVDHVGACGLLICFGNADCAEDEFCKRPPGHCDATDLAGVCQPIPDACPLIYDPVCGCDGVTYGNACEADLASAQVDHPGECAQVCGGIAGILCDPGEFCKLPEGLCDVADLQGVCEPIPIACPLFYNPVCGCDGVTYNNSCDADRAGVQIDHLGQCGHICGGFIGLPCNPDEYCMYPNGTCNFADHFGVCVPIPEACPDVCHPVCGCDGVTYDNLCLAQRAQVSLDHRGECDPTGRLIHKVLFSSPQRMHWQQAPGALSYNVYVEVHQLPPPVDAGDCYLSGLPTPGANIIEDPEVGDVWLFQVTGNFTDGEGPMGTSSDCAGRAAEVSCADQ